MGRMTRDCQSNDQKIFYLQFAVIFWGWIEGRTHLDIQALRIETFIILQGLKSTFNLFFYA